MDWSLGLVSWDGVLEWILELNFESRNRKNSFLVVHSSPWVNITQNVW